MLRCAFQIHKVNLAAWHNTFESKFRDRPDHFTGGSGHGLRQVNRRYVLADRSQQIAERLTAFQQRLMEHISATKDQKIKNVERMADNDVAIM